jgi:hypothetical protein
MINGKYINGMAASIAPPFPERAVEKRSCFMGRINVVARTATAMSSCDDLLRLCAELTASVTRRFPHHG